MQGITGRRNRCHDGRRERAQQVGEPRTKAVPQQQVHGLRITHLAELRMCGLVFIKDTLRIRRLESRSTNGHAGNEQSINTRTASQAAL